MRTCGGRGLSLFLFTEVAAPVLVVNHQRRHNADQLHVPRCTFIFCFSFPLFSASPLHKLRLPPEKQRFFSPLAPTSLAAEGTRIFYLILIPSYILMFIHCLKAVENRRGRVVRKREGGSFFLLECYAPGGPIRTSCYTVMKRIVCYAPGGPARASPTRAP